MKVAQSRAYTQRGEITWKGKALSSYYLRNLFIDILFSFYGILFLLTRLLRYFIYFSPIKFHIIKQEVSYPLHFNDAVMKTLTIRSVNYLFVLSPSSSSKRNYCINFRDIQFSLLIFNLLSKLFPMQK